MLDLESIPRVQRCPQCRNEFRVTDCDPQCPKCGELRERYRQWGVLCVNFISAPGSGKTLLLEKALERMDKGTRVAVFTGDLQTENDAKRLTQFGFPVK